MARIRRVTAPAGLLFMGATVSAGLYQEITERAAEKYDPVLKALRPKDLLDLIRLCPTISLVRHRSLQVDIVIAGIDGTRVNLWMMLDLHGPLGDVESFLRGAVERFLPESGLTVGSGALLGQITLLREPYRIPTPHNGAQYFSGTEGELALSITASHLRLAR